MNMNQQQQHEQPVAGDPLEAKMADPAAVKDFWLDVVRSADRHGRLEKVPTVKGVSPRGRDIARTQNRQLTRAVFSGAASTAYQHGYSRIRWGEGHGTDRDA